MDLGLLGYFAALGLGACGSAAGIGLAGQAAIGVFKKAYMAGKNASAVLFALVGAPFTQTIYGFILMNALKARLDAGIENTAAIFGIGVFGGLGIGVSAWFQGLAGAAGCDALGETGKGFGMYMVILGVVETVAIFSMVFGMLSAGTLI
ncbi:MAG: V-type ATP synthase subunit K [Spirochaetia bacterium]